MQELSLARPNDISFQLTQVFTSHPKVPGALTSKAGRQRARELTESGSLNFKAAILGYVPRATKPRLPEKQGSRSLNFKLLISSGAELLRSWTGKVALGKGGKTKKKKCVSHPNFITAVTFPGIVSTSQIQVFLQLLKKRVCFAQRNDF